jgi:hypothetical protein
MQLCLTVIVLTNGHAFGQAPALPAPFGPHQWTATAKIIGEDGNPIAGAKVAFTYDVPRLPGSSQPTFAEVKGFTDNNGTFSASHTDSSWNLGVVVEKAGCYATHTGYEFYFDDKRRHPNFTLMLKQIGKPISMYAKFITYIKFPVFNKPIGYDLKIGDWIIPYGKGVDTDFLFTENHTNVKSGGWHPGIYKRLELWR